MVARGNKSMLAAKLVVAVNNNHERVKLNMLEKLSMSKSSKVSCHFICIFIDAGQSYEQRLVIQDTPRIDPEWNS